MLGSIAFAFGVTHGAWDNTRKEKRLDPLYRGEMHLGGCRYRFDFGLLPVTQKSICNTLKKMPWNSTKKFKSMVPVFFRDFELLKSQDSFQELYKAVGMRTCLDPLHSVSARPTLDGNKNSLVYEAAHKERPKNFFIGMDNFFFKVEVAGIKLLVSHCAAFSLNECINYGELYYSFLEAPLQTSANNNHHHPTNTGVRPKTRNKKETSVCNISTWDNKRKGKK